MKKVHLYLFLRYIETAFDGRININVVCLASHADVFISCVTKQYFDICNFIQSKGLF